MIYTLRFKNLWTIFPVLGVCFGLSACGSAAKKLSNDSVNAIAAGKMGGIVLSLEAEKIPCAYGGLSVRNTQTGHTVGTSLIVVSWDKKRNTKLLSVPPGTYKMAGGYCQAETPGGNFNYTSNTKFRGMEGAYSAFKVKAGELVYPGTFIVRGRKANGAPYDVIDLAQFKAQGIAKKYKGLADRFVSRPVSVIGRGNTGLQPRSGYINKN